MILVSKTYTETTPESAENGDSSDDGFVYENVEMGFRELVEVLCIHPNASATVVTRHTWFSTDYYIDDYATYTERVESIHYSQDNPPRNLKYWLKAIRAAKIRR